MSLFDYPVSLFLACIIAGYALLGLTLTLASLLAPFITILHIIAILVIVIFSAAIIFKGLRSLFLK